MKPSAHHPTSEELFAYRDGELPTDRRSVIEAHVLACTHCREQIDEMSALESDLRLRPDAVGEEYYEQMTESVLARVTAPAPVLEEAVVDPTPRVDRRRPDAAAADGGEARRRLRLPWIGIAGTGAAALAVALVAVLLLNRQEDWVRAPRPGVLGEMKGRTAGKDSALARSRARKADAASRKDQVAEVGQGKKVAAGQEKKVAATRPPGTAAPEGAASREQAPPSEAPSLGAEGTREYALQKTTQNSEPPAAGTKDETQTSAKMRTAERAGAPPADQTEADLPKPSDRAPGEAYARVLREHGLPVVWDDRVPPDALLRAESGLRLVYQTHKAGADSARIRLYLAEAERARLGDSADPASIERIANHYRRAIGLARGDAALAALARRRLGELLVTRPPALDQPPTTP